MYYRLRAGLSFCVVEARAIFLDLEADRYFMLQGTLERAFKAFAAGDELSSEALGLLERARILQPCVEAGRAPLPLAIGAPLGSILEEPGIAGSIKPWTTAAALFALSSARRRLRREGFARSIARLRSRRPGRAGGNIAQNAIFATLAADFLAARSAFPAPPNCLPDSLALLDFLDRRGARADLVIGVRLDPYAAHCWVQAKKTLLNESINYTASFTPILIA
jgi:hypothetical protein